MKKIIFVVLIAAVIASGCLFGENSYARGSKRKSDVRFFQPGSFYIYVMGSYTHLSPPVDLFLPLGDEAANAFGPTIGVGFRIVNFGNKVFINLEGDYTLTSFDFAPYAEDQKVHMITLGFNVEGRLSPRFHLFGGMGVTFHRFSDLGYYGPTDIFFDMGGDTITTLELALGIKIPISRNLSFRTEFRINSEVYGDFDYYDDYYYDEYYDDEFSDWEFVSSSFMIGLELRF